MKLLPARVSRCGTWRILYRERPSRMFVQDYTYLFLYSQVYMCTGEVKPEKWRRERKRKSREIARRCLVAPPALATLLSFSGSLVSSRPLETLCSFLSTPLPFCLYPPANLSAPLLRRSLRARRVCTARVGKAVCAWRSFSLS